MAAAELLLLTFLLLRLLTPPAASRERLAERASAASELGWSRMVERLTLPALSGIGNGGYVTLEDEVSGIRQDFGPGAYVEGQAYDLDWFLQGMSAGIGRPRDETVEAEVIETLVRIQNPKDGSWPWSDDGCIHELMGTELLLRGRRKEGLRALGWAMEWGLAGHVLPNGDILEVESERVIKSWWALRQPPKPVVDGIPPAPEPSPKEQRRFAYDELPMLLRFMKVAGQERKHPEMSRRLKLGLRRLIEEFDPGPARGADFIELLGVTDYAALVAEGLMPRDALFAKTRDLLLDLAKAESRKTPADPLVLGLLLTGMAETGLSIEHPGLSDRLAARLLSMQDRGGEWPMPVHVFRFNWLGETWGEASEDLRVGRTVGELESLPTFIAARALRYHAWSVTDPARLSRVLSLRSVPRER